MQPQADNTTGGPSAHRRPSLLSLIVWGVIGTVTGFVVGGLGLEISGFQGIGGATVNVRVEVFGLTLRQGVGPESMERVIWTWGVAALAAFAALGAWVFLTARLVVGWVGSRTVRAHGSGSGGLFGL